MFRFINIGKIIDEIRNVQQIKLMQAIIQEVKCVIEAQDFKFLSCVRKSLIIILKRVTKKFIYQYKNRFI